MVRQALVVTALIILVVVAATWFLLPALQEAEAQAIVGKTAVPLIILAVLWKLVQIVVPEAAKLSVAWLLRKIGILPLSLKRLVVRNEVEGNLRRAVKEFGHEGRGMLPYPPKLEWVSLSDVSPDSFFRDGKIIIRLDYAENPHRNIVEAALLYCRAGLIPETRRYLWKSLARALDLVFVYAMLERNDLREGSLYFVHDVLEPELENSPDVEKHYSTLHGLHENGFFTRILLPELRDYAGRVHLADTRAQHRQRITNFIGFLAEVAQERPGGTKKALDHIKKRFRISIIIVGERWKLAFEGQRPYIKRIARCAAEGARTIFLIGPSDAIPDIAENARKLGITDSKECQCYHVSRRRKIRREWCACLEISEQTAASALDRIPGVEDWPDFEVVVETGEEEAGESASDVA